MEQRRDQGRTGKGHPLPGSGEARHDEIPEHLEREKGRGDDPRPVVQPPGDAVAPDGEPYPSGPERTPESEADEVKADQAAHQDRGQSIAESETTR
jgi:hypothetical protein